MTFGKRAQLGCHPLGKVDGMLLSASKRMIRIVRFDDSITVAVAPDRQMGDTIPAGRQIERITNIADARRNDVKRRINRAQQRDYPAWRHPPGTQMGDMGIRGNTCRIDNEIAGAIQAQRLV